jgi:hypothetical protein
MSVSFVRFFPPFLQLISIFPTLLDYDMFFSFFFMSINCLSALLADNIFFSKITNVVKKHPNFF